MSDYYLEIIRGHECGRRYLLGFGASSIGRNPQNPIALPPDEIVISGHHAIIYCSAEKIFIQDLQSTNGTYVNETRINETDLWEGDVVGFGKTGPRLRLIRSDNDSPEESLNRPSVQILSTEDNCDSNDKHESDFFNTDESSAKSLTMELERKLYRKEINDDEALKLLKNNRMEKIINRGKLGKTQSGLLRTIYGANNKTKRTWIYAFISLLFLTFVISGWSYVKIHQYRKLLSNAKSLQEEIGRYDKKIVDINANPNKDEGQLKELINQIEKKEKSLSSIRSQIDTEDFDKIFQDDLEKRIDEILRRFGESDYHICDNMVERVRYHMEYYSKELKPVIQRYLQRKATYFPMIHKIFGEEHIPAEFAYVSMLESGFNPNALSKAGARGLWQFMTSTGRKYGLTINDTVDERTDPQKATYAAAKYIKELLGIFGTRSSFMLCLAAYNAGEGKILSILRNIDDPVRNRDFWYIYRMGYLTEETNEYIPRLLALIIISEHAEEYGFHKDITPGNEKRQVQENDFLEIDFRVK
jgi:hypothetical protein